MGLFDALNISASALAAERQRSEVAATNLANVDTTHRTDGAGPFRRKEVVLTDVAGARFRSLLGNASSLSDGGLRQPGTVRLTRVVDDPAAPIRRYEPSHPDADKDGYVAYPNDQPRAGDGGPDGFGARIPVECIRRKSASKQMIQQSIDLLKS